VSLPPGSRPRSRGRRALSAAALGLLVIALSGCTNNEFTRLGWPDPVTKQGKVMLTLWQGSWIAAWAVGGRRVGPDHLGVHLPPQAQR
jgi:cytochrome c oxidase subunit 2